MPSHTLDTSTSLKLEVRLLRAAARAPDYHSAHAAGMDLSACPEDGGPIRLEPGAIRLVPCGIAIAIPSGFEGQVRPRSGLASRHGITLVNSPGTIDSDYRGEVKVPLINLGGEPFTIEPGTRIAQLVIAPVARAAVELVGDLSPTSRGDSGFGSTGA